MNIYCSKEEFKEMRKRERWKVWQCYICCLHILYKRKQKEEKKKKKKTRGKGRKEEREEPISYENIQITRVVDLNFILQMLQLARGKKKKSSVNSY